MRVLRSGHYGDHALSSPCGGGRTVRHNAVRNICFEEAKAASLRPEREKAGLLPDRPPADDTPAQLPPSHVRRHQGRRPADVWLPRGQHGRAEALDFAVTSAMRADVIPEAASSPELVFERYNRLKREFKGTAEACDTAGFTFVPMVIEAHSGGWSPLARTTLDWIARQASACTGEEHGPAALRIAQRISATLHRENARAIHKRSASELAGSFYSGWVADGGGLAADGGSMP